MTQKAVQLIPLLCVRCQAQVPARVDEVAWVCQNCGQSQVLDSAPSGKTALHAQEFFYSAALRPGVNGRPFWVSAGKVTITRRDTYQGDERRAAQDFWSAPHLFCVPAWDSALEEAVAFGVELLKKPFPIQIGPPAPFLPVVTLPQDMHALAEFMVVSIEAGRNDALKHIELNLELADPALWILP